MFGDQKSGNDLGQRLARDPQGIVLRDLRARLMEGRAQTANAQAHGAELALRAYDAALAALPEIWRAKQRSK